MAHQLEMLRKAPPEPALSRERDPLLISERDGYALGRAWRWMPNDVRRRFPMLERVSTSFVAEHDERLLLSPVEVLDVLAEFSRVLSVCRFESFEHGLDAKAFFERWREETPEDEFRTEIESISLFLQQAVDRNAWIYIWH